LEMDEEGEERGGEEDCEEGYPGELEELRLLEEELGVMGI